MTTLLDTIREELREQEGALREQSEQFRNHDYIVLGVFEDRAEASEFLNSIKHFRHG